VAKRGAFIDPEAESSPFAAIAGLRAALPDAPAPVAAAAAAPPLAAAPPKGPARAVLRIERKGHGGRDATRVSHLELAADDLAAWLVDAKRALGCGGAVDGADLVLQGDVRDRLTSWLTSRGVRRVTR
jgi:translation initiation factor 1